MKSFQDYIASLPPFIGMEIFKFIIPDTKSIIFKSQEKRRGHDKYNLKYEIAYFYNSEYLDSLVMNNRGIYLSRIFKKNGKHRYYLSAEKMFQYCAGCGEYNCSNLDCSGIYSYEHSYSSRYVGKDLSKALLELGFEEPVAADDEPLAISTEMPSAPTEMPCAPTDW